MNRAERVAYIADRFYGARRTLRDLFGDEYAERIEPWRRVVRALAAKEGCDPLLVPTLIQPQPSGYQMLALLAAIVDEIEPAPPPVPAPGEREEGAPPRPGRGREGKR